jgi:hypothetical protein
MNSLTSGSWIGMVFVVVILESGCFIFAFFFGKIWLANLGHKQ